MQKKQFLRKIEVKKSMFFENFGTKNLHYISILQLFYIQNIYIKYIVEHKHLLLHKV